MQLRRGREWRECRASTVSLHSLPTARRVASAAPALAAPCTRHTPQPQPPRTYRTPIPVTALSFSLDGEFLASSGYHEVLLWRVSDGGLVRRIEDLPQRSYGIDFSPDGESFVVASGTPGGVGEVTHFRLQDAFVRALQPALSEAGLSIPFPVRTLDFAGQPVRIDKG